MSAIIPTGVRCWGIRGLYLVGVFYKGRGAFYNMEIEAAIAAEQITEQLSQRVFAAVAL